MKRALSILVASVGLASLFASGVANAASDPLMGTLSPVSLESARLARVQLANYAFVTSEYARQYADSRAYVAAVKGRVISGYEDGRIGYYRMYDIITDVEYLAKQLDMYFWYLRASEYADRDANLAFAADQLERVNGAQKKLKNHLYGSLDTGEERSSSVAPGYGYGYGNYY